MQNPPGTNGRSWLITARPRMARPDAAACPTHRRAVMHPLLEAVPALPYRPAMKEEFGFGPLFTALDLWEFEEWSLEEIREELRGTRGKFRGAGAPVHPVLLAWTAAALVYYTGARTEEQRAAVAAGLPETAPVRQEWHVRSRRADLPDPRGARQYEQTVWGRSYQSADGTVRDLWLPSMGRAKKRRHTAELAAVAQVVALGAPEHRRPWGQEPPETSTAESYPGPRPQLIRVFDVGCADGSVELLLSEGPEAVDSRYRQDAAPAFQEAVTGQGVQPGESCVDCKALAGCNSLKQSPGLWGGSPPVPARKRRSVSAWDLRLYGECPAQYHLVRKLHLNDLSQEGAGARRGRVVDNRLNEQHSLRPLRGCWDLDIPGVAELTSGDGLDETSAREAAAMLASHRFLCPLDGLGPGEQVLVQPQITAYVPELDVVVLAKPDLVYTHRGRWMWRETKTASKPLWERESLLRTYPQLALGVLLMHASVVGGNPRRSWVQLEHLREDHRDSRLELIDPSRAEIVEEAREVIADLATPLLQDTVYEPTPGRHCHGCQARTWCRRGTAYVAGDQRPGVGAPEQGAPCD